MSAPPPPPAEFEGEIGVRGPRIGMSSSPGSRFSFEFAGGTGDPES